DPRFGARVPSRQRPGDGQRLWRLPRPLPQRGPTGNVRKVRFSRETPASREGRTGAISYGRKALLREHGAGIRQTRQRQCRTRWGGVNQTGQAREALEGANDVKN